MALPASENVTLPRDRRRHQRFWRLFHNIPLLGLPLRSPPVHNVSPPSQVTALLEGLKLEPTKRFRFLDLPPEIRNIIYQLHLETRDPCRVYTGNTERPQAGVNLLRCCKQINREATQYVNHKRWWIIGDPKLTEFELLWLSPHGPTNDPVLFRDRKYFAHREKSTLENIVNLSVTIHVRSYHVCLSRGPQRLSYLAMMKRLKHLQICFHLGGCSGHAFKGSKLHYSLWNWIDSSIPKYDGQVVIRRLRAFHIHDSDLSPAFQCKLMKGQKV